MAYDFKQQFPDLSGETVNQLSALAAVFREWNARINLVSRKDIDQLEAHHLAPCVAVTRVLTLMHGARVLDVGTGGGLPGLVMAVCYPHARFHLIDSIGKKITAVGEMAHALGLKNVKVEQARAESLRSQYDFVTGRAVTTLPVFVGWTWRLMQPGNKHSLPNGLLYWKGGDLEPEYEALRARPHKVWPLAPMLGNDPYFEGKQLLHFRAGDLYRKGQIQ
jgi:16S rRNA (guanine527-N7)-methyltransferase